MTALLAFGYVCEDFLNYLQIEKRRCKMCSIVVMTDKKSEKNQSAILNHFFHVLEGTDSENPLRLEKEVAD